jgi:hypothetical protein
MVASTPPALREPCRRGGRLSGELADDDRFQSRTSTLLVHPSGATQHAAAAPALLADDCSDEPASFGACIAAVKSETGRNGVHHVSTFALPDGGRIVVDVDITQFQGGVVTRSAADHSTVWTRNHLEQADATIRGTTLLVIDGSFASASALDIATGAPRWTVLAPSSL